MADGVEIDGSSMTVYHSDPGPMQPVLDALRAHEVIIAEMREVRQSLEELFMESVGEGVGGTKPGANPPRLPGKEVVS